MYCIDKPQVRHIQQDLHFVHERETLLLQCSSSANPSVEEWFWTASRKESSLTGDESLNNNNGNNKWKINKNELNVEEITQGDSGNYTCHARNQVGSGSATVQVFVLCMR